MGQCGNGRKRVCFGGISNRADRIFCLRHQTSIKWANHWTRAINKNNRITPGVLQSYFTQKSCFPLLSQVFSIVTIVFQLEKVVQWETRFRIRLPNVESNSQDPKVTSKAYSSTANHADLRILHTLFLLPLIEDGASRSHYPSHIRTQHQRERLSTAGRSARSASSLTIRLL